MNENIRIAKALVRLAKELVANDEQQDGGTSVPTKKETRETLKKLVKEPGKMKEVIIDNNVPLKNLGITPSMPVSVVIDKIFNQEDAEQK